MSMLHIYAASFCCMAMLHMLAGFQNYMPMLQISTNLKRKEATSTKNRFVRFALYRLVFRVHFTGLFSNDLAE
jgi:hypothetical protein